MCGVTGIPDLDLNMDAGLSPRVRGHLLIGLRAADLKRSIPACAGSPSGRADRRPSMWVYPRVCGVTLGRGADSVTGFGLSPRVRGHREPIRRANHCRGSIPACAGSPAREEILSRYDEVYPRVCGVTGIPDLDLNMDAGLSPRVRGHLAIARQEKRLDRSIPACAGSPSPRRVSADTGRVYPRVCGVTL